MESIGRSGTGKAMPFAVRPLEERDIAQSALIEREAFPNLFPATSFRRELKNKIASYLSAWRTDDLASDEVSTDQASGTPEHHNDRVLIDKLIRNVGRLWHKSCSDGESAEQFIAGFLGTWYVVDEAHIVSVGVRRAYQGRGIGEMLLIGAIEQAMARRARVVTLEVRVSNQVARNLYMKYGFKARGLRKGYYSDNREDALIMTTDPIITSPYPESFQKLVQAHEQRWGPAERVLS